MALCFSFLVSFGVVSLQYMYISGVYGSLEGRGDREMRWDAVGCRL